MWKDNAANTDKEEQDTGRASAQGMSLKKHTIPCCRNFKRTMLIFFSKYRK